MHTKHFSDIIQGTELWKAAQLCLVHGLLQLDGNRFFPQNPIEKEDLLTVIQSNNMVGINLPDGVITRADAALLLKEYLLESAKKKLPTR